jgi:thioredoxin-dependent peroxiredoxin
MYGKKYFGTERTTFVIDEQGRIAAVFPQVKPAEHVDRLLEVLG